jgi:cytochrome c oxidase assembly factor CtaG
MTPLGVVAMAGAALSVGAFIRHPHRSQRVWGQFALSIFSWGLLWFAAASPFERLGMMNLPDHMIGHVIVMFAVPMGLIASSTLRHWARLLPVGWRRRLQRWWYLNRRVRIPRAMANPIVAALVLNGVMVASHLPRLFDAIMLHDWMMQWLMEPAFLLSGFFFFHYLIPSWPRPVNTRLRLQFLMVAVSMFEMLVMAMAMSIFTKTNWYSVMTLSSMPSMPYMPGMGISPATAFAHQQLAAAILWICGDFWAVPCLVLIIRRLVLREGSLMGALERQTSRLSSVTSA